jgi:hypothetical protein
MSNNTPKKKRGWIYLLLAAALGVCMVFIPKHKADAATVVKADVASSLTHAEKGVKETLARL